MYALNLKRTKPVVLINYDINIKQHQLRRFYEIYLSSYNFIIITKRIKISLLALEIYF